MATITTLTGQVAAQAAVLVTDLLMAADPAVMSCHGRMDLYGLVWTCMDLPYRDYMGSTRSHSGQEHPRTCPGVLFPIIVPVHSHLGPICANWTFGVPARCERPMSRQAERRIEGSTRVFAIPPHELDYWYHHWTPSDGGSGVCLSIALSEPTP